MVAPTTNGWMSAICSMPPRRYCRRKISPSVRRSASVRLSGIRYVCLLRIVNRLLGVAVPVVFSALGRHFGDGTAGEALDEMKPHVGAGGDTRRGDMAARVDPARDVVPVNARAESGHPSKGGVIRGGRLAVEEPGRREDRGAGADGSHDRDPLVHRPHPLKKRASLLGMIVGKQDTRALASRNHQ